MTRLKLFFQQFLRELEPLTWISYRLLRSRSKSIFQGTSWSSFAGLVLGVGCLVVSMAVMSGFESTLQRSVADVTGHLRIRKPGLETAEWSEILRKIKSREPEIQASVEYAFVEGVLAYQGKLSGVLLQGVDPTKIDDVLNLRGRLIAGDFRITQEQIPELLIGKGLAQNFGLKPGQEFRVVFPLPADIDPSQFRRKVATFKVAGILDLGKKEFDDRLMIISLPALQKVAETKASSGLLLRVANIDHARQIGLSLSQILDPTFQISDWRDINENLFEAVQIERVVVFFVIFVIIMASAFNVSSALYINVVRRYPEIGVLKALGLSQKKVVEVFSLQGLMLGILGLALGIGLGLVFCVIFSWAERQYGLIPTAVYKVDHIDLRVRFWDLFWIVIATLGICFVATLAPAIKGARLSPVEGLKHD